MSGATLCLGTKDSLLPGADLIQLLRNQKITTVTLPPSVLAALPAEELPALRTIIVAGEACPPNLVARWAGEHQFFNAYGPTEVTVCATFAECTNSSKKPPIGRPISNTQVYLLDNQMQSVPVGVPGEMYIGGTGLARGYLNRPDLTAERFIPNPFSDQPGDRLYKTGDLGQYLPDGNIEFLSRIDQQVKIRGFRIELGEIEAVLSQHPDVREAVVMSREDVPGDKRMVAYIVPNLTTDLQATVIRNLRGFLTQKLPDYMVPSSFVMLNALPLTPNGKVDRRALPAPDRTGADRSDNFVAPSTLVEEILAGIWAEVLGLDQIGIHDNFLELGGHSLLATQVISRVRDKFQVELPLRELFETPTVAGLAASIETAGSQQGSQILPVSPAFEDRCDVLRHALRVHSRLRRVSLPQRCLTAWRRARKPHLGLGASLHEDLPLSFAQERLWFLDQLIPNHPFYNVPQAVRLTGSLNVTALEQSLNELIRRHEVLRTTFAKVNGQPIQVINPAPTFTLPIVNLQNLPKVEREERAWQLMTEDAQLPFDLAQGPLLRATLFQMSGAESLSGAKDEMWFPPIGTHARGRFPP